MNEFCAGEVMVQNQSTLKVQPPNKGRGTPVCAHRCLIDRGAPCPRLVLGGGKKQKGNACSLGCTTNSGGMKKEGVGRAGPGVRWSRKVGRRKGNNTWWMCGKVGSVQHLTSLHRACSLKAAL